MRQERFEHPLLRVKVDQVEVLDCPVGEGKNGPCFLRDEDLLMDAEEVLEVSFFGLQEEVLDSYIELKGEEWAIVEEAFDSFPEVSDVEIRHDDRVPVLSLSALSEYRTHDAIADDTPIDDEVTALLQDFLYDIESQEFIQGPHHSSMTCIMEQCRYEHGSLLKSGESISRELQDVARHTQGMEEIVERIRKVVLLGFSKNLCVDEIAGEDTFLENRHLPPLLNGGSFTHGM